MDSTEFSGVDLRSMEARADEYVTVHAARYGNRPWSADYTAAVLVAFAKEELRRRLSAPPGRG